MYILDLIKYAFILTLLYPALLLNHSSFLVCLLPIFGFITASSLFIYGFSFFFAKEENGQKFYILTVLILSLGFVYMDLEEVFNPKNIKQISLISDNYKIGLAQLFPSSNLLLTLYSYWFVVLAQSDDISKIMFQNVSSTKIIVNSMINFGLQIVLYSLILFLFEKQYFEKLYTKLISIFFLKADNPDAISNEYVNKEKSKVKNESSLRTPLTFKIDNVTKLFRPLCAPKVYAVNDVMFCLILFKFLNPFLTQFYNAVLNTI